MQMTVCSFACFTFTFIQDPCREDRETRHLRMDSPEYTTSNALIVAIVIGVLSWYFWARRVDSASRQRAPHHSHVDAEGLKRARQRAFEASRIELERAKAERNAAAAIEMQQRMEKRRLADADKAAESVPSTEAEPFYFPSSRELRYEPGISNRNLTSIRRVSSN